jgi:hypothetical protein
VDAPRGDSQACPRPSPFADTWSVNRADIDRHRDLIADARTRLDELVTAMSTLMVHGRQEDLERLQNARPWWLRNGPEIVRLIKEAEPAKTYMRDRTWYLTNLYSHPTLSEVLSLLENVAPNTNIEESADKARDLFTEYEGYLDRQEQCWIKSCSLTRVDAKEPHPRRDHSHLGVRGDVRVRSGISQSNR